jgi:hypothetical protein
MLARLDVASPRTLDRYKRFFAAAALYDAALGIGFFLLYKPIFKALGIRRPENSSYVLLTSGFVAVQGLGYFFVARDPRRNVDIVKVGAVYKFVYSALTLYYLTTGQLLHNIFAWFGALDVAFLVGFLQFLREAQQKTGETTVAI